MVAKVISGNDIKGALNYNEQKVQEGKATCIMASLFKRDVEELSFYDKLNRFTDLNEKNKRTRTNTLHISLNFDSTEQLKVSELNAIALTYMNRIGFGDQPFLVYEHKDAAHQHIHIVTTIIRKDGKRIPINYLGKYKSEKARKEIEKEFKLVIAEKQNKSDELAIRPAILEKALYGKSLTKRSITHVVNAVVVHYKYTSLAELNAILRQFNGIADRGDERSTMFEKRGLLYSIVNAKGERVGIPVKASAIYGKPTLDFLEKQFKLNAVLRQPYKEMVKTAIDKVLKDHAIATREQFHRALIKKDINVVMRTNAEGRTFGMTFIDHYNKTVFNGSDLGKNYSASALQKRLSINSNTIKPFRPGYTNVVPVHDSPGDKGESLLHQIMESEDTAVNAPDALGLGKRKKRRKGRRI